MLPHSPGPAQLCVHAHHTPSGAPQHLGPGNPPPTLPGSAHSGTLGHADSLGLQGEEGGCNGEIMEEQMAEEKKASVYQH